MSSGDVPLEELSTAQRLSKDLEDYKVASAAARAAAQLKTIGKTVSAGQSVRYLRVLGSPDVLPLEMLNNRKAISLDFAWYQDSFLIAAHEVLQAFGVEKAVLRQWLLGSESYFIPEDYATNDKKELPLFTHLRGQHNK